MPGYETDRFINLSTAEKSDYSCSICQGIFWCPVTVPCCLQTFCHDCITNWLTNHDTCPYDRKGLTIDKLTKVPRVLQNILGKLNIRCNYWDNGCRQVVKLSDITEHSATCERNEANGFKLCDTCCCNITGDHKCLDAVVLANRKANDRIDLLQCTVNQLTLEKDQLVKSVQELSNVQSDDRLIKDNRQLRHEVQELKKEKTIENVRVFGNILSMIGNDNVDLAENIGITYLHTLSANINVRPLLAILKVMDKLLKLIDHKIERSEHDKYLSTTWNIIWNITDTIQPNCQQFIEMNGMYRFVKCIDLLPDNIDVIEAMLGVISNVAEYDELKPQLLANKYIQSLLKLLETSVYKQSINCKSAGILTNLAAIGINNWPDNLGDDCKFDKVIQKINIAIEGWKLNTGIFGNYNTLLPILHLLQPEIASDCYYYPVWLLSNCTRVRSSYYSQLLRQEKGLDTLETLIKRANITPIIKQLATLTLYQCELAENDPGAMRLMAASECIEIPDEFVQQKQIN